MEYGSGVLTQNIIYKSAEITNQKTPLEQIKYISFSDQYTNMSILTKLVNLSIIYFRLCSLQFFPEELFELKNLQVIDLSGNQISILPDKAKFSSFKKLFQLNLSDNNISNIDEIYKLEQLSNLKMLILTGNSCLTFTNSTDLIIDIFPHLIVLNEQVITSQYRANLLGLSIFSENQLVPIEKADDFIFLFAKFLHAPAPEKYIRRTSAETFCLSRAIRRYSYVEKIQSVFRGFVQKKKYILLKRTAKHLHNFFKLWYQRRKVAANKIKFNFLHFQLRRKIKKIVSARLIQSVWRGFKIRRLCLISIFEKDDKVVFFVTTPHLRQLKNFLKKKNLPFPDEESESNFRKIRMIEPKKQRLPGSPLVFYTIDNSSLIRPFKVKKMTKDSIWCRHDHSVEQTEVRVSKDGVNFSPQCHFGIISYKPYTKPIKPSKVPSYDSFVRCTYKDKSLFSSILSILCSDPPKRLRLFNEETIKIIGSILVVQSSCRSFLVRCKTFRLIKKKALENRSAQCIKHFIHSMYFKNSITHSLDVLHYYRSISDTNVFYVTKKKLDLIFLAKVDTKYHFKYGYSYDRYVMIEKGKMQLPMLFIQTGKPVYSDQDLPSLFKFGVSSTKVIPSMFKSIPKKWLKRIRMVRLTFANPDEARTRIALYAYLTRDFKSFMDEFEVVRFYAANSIKNAWIGFIMRKTIMHLGAQAGKKLNLQCLIKHNIKEKNDEDDEENQNKLRNKFSLNYNTDDPNKMNFLKRKDMNPNEAITILRSDYKPWESNFKKFKEINDFSNDKNSSSINDSAPTQSMYKMGLVNNLENAFARTNPIEKANSKTTNINKKTRSSLTAMISKTQPIKKPLVSSLRFPKKPLLFQIEIETQKIFGPTLHRIQNNQTPILQKKPKILNSIPLPDLVHPNTPVDFDSISQTDSSSIVSNAEPKQNKTRKPLFEETNNSTNNNKLQSMQKHNEFVKTQNQIHSAFVKLVRLKQIGIEIMELTTVNKIREENKKKATETRKSIEFHKNEINIQKEKNLKNLKERNEAENKIYQMERQEIESRASKRKNIKINNMKNEIETKNQQNREQKNFSQNFVSISSKIASNSDRLKQTNEVTIIKTDTDSISKIRNQASKIQKIKQESTKWSKFLNDQKIETNKILHSEKIDRISKLKKRSMMASHQKIIENKSIDYSSIYESPLFYNDPIQEAAQIIGKYVGENLGEIESLLISQIIQNIVQ